MNKNDLISQIAKEAGVTKDVATKTLNATLAAITSCLARNDSVTLVGFGTFQVKERSAREGRNPKTGATIKIPAASIPGFKPGKNFKELVNK